MSDTDPKPEDEAPLSDAAEAAVPEAAIPEVDVPEGGMPEAEPDESEASPPEAEAPEGAAATSEGRADEATSAAEDESQEEGSPEGESQEDGAPEAAAPERKKPEWKPPPPERLEGAIEALLLVAGDVVRVERLRDLLGLQSVLPVREALAAIEERWSGSGLAFEIEQVGGGVRVVTRPEYAEYVGRLSRRPASDKLSRAQLETLCIVAYKQPVGRAEVERIRGVQAGDPLRALLERRLIKVTGRSDQPGRPLLYGTTQLFLTAFGLNELKDLPAPKDMQRL